VVSPASFPEADDWLERPLRVLSSWGLRVEVAQHAEDRWGYMAGRDEDRLADLDDAFRDPGVRAIVASRGGAGAYRIVGRVDVAAVRADPKPVVGYSDISYLHLGLFGRAGLVGVHGTVGAARAEASLRQVLFTSEPVVLHRDPAALSAQVHVPGRASGVLIGGNVGGLPLGPGRGAVPVRLGVPVVLDADAGTLTCG
jgi:muramoyltetrapeptide carboxypeptidase